jgi:hypothetical protein
MDEQPAITRSRRAVAIRARIVLNSPLQQVSHEACSLIFLKLPPRRPIAISSELLIRYRLLAASFSAYLPHRPTTVYPMFLSEKSIINNHIMLRHRGELA